MGGIERSDSAESPRRMAGRLRFHLRIAESDIEPLRLESVDLVCCGAGQDQSRGFGAVEAVIFIGLPGSGKSSFFKERFFRTHVRISLDLLKTRHRETRLLDVCLETDQRFVIDNTNPTKAERSRFIQAVKAARVRYVISGYYFESKVEDCLRRSARRPDVERVPDVAILSAAKKLELPSFDEGFDQLYYVRLTEDGFVVEEWNDAAEGGL